MPGVMATIVSSWGKKIAKTFDSEPLSSEDADTNLGLLNSRFS